MWEGISFLCFYLAIAERWGAFEAEQETAPAWESDLCWNPGVVLFKIPLSLTFLMIVVKIE